MHDDLSPLIVTKRVAVPKDNIGFVAWEDGYLLVRLKAVTGDYLYLTLRDEEAKDFWHQYTGEIITD